MCATDNMKHVVIISSIARQLQQWVKGQKEGGEEGAGTSALSEVTKQRLLLPPAACLLPAIKVLYSVAQCALRISVSAFGHLCL